MTTTAGQEKMYVNDLLKSLDSTCEARTLYHEMKELFSDSGFTLTKWSANSQEILDKVPEEDHAPQAWNLSTHSFNPAA